jgi:carboxyl-terminal processing protease
VVVWLAALAATVSLALAAGFHSRGAYRFINVFQEVWGLTQANYVEKVDEAELLEGAYRGMLTSLDAASSYLSDRELELIESEPGPAGAGMDVLLSGGVPVVVRVDPQGPAAEAGLHRGDQIWRIDGEPTRQTAWPVLDRMLRGPADREMELVILDSRTFKLRELALSLAEPVDPGFRLEAPQGQVLWLTLDEPELVAPSALASALAAESTKHPGAPLVVDLRGQVGVDPRVAARLGAALFAGRPSLRLVSRSGSEEVVAGDAPQPGFPGRIYGLIDGGTAGSAEALAATIKDLGGLLCGRRTYGLAGVPEVIALTHGGTILLTTREMRGPAGTGWAGDGLEPDKILGIEPRADASADPGADRLRDAALEWILEGAPLDEERPAA